MVAAFGIVAFHANAPYRELSYAGLIVFLILSPYYDCANYWEKPRSVKHLMTAFLLPWLFWTALYGVLRLALNRPLFLTDHWFEGILYGTSPHLWFLPAMLFVLGILAILKSFMSAKALYRISTTAAALLLLSSHFWRDDALSWSPPFAQWMHAAPAVLIGISLGLRQRTEMAERRVGALALTIAMASLFIDPQEGMAVTYTVGTVLTLLALTPKAGRLSALWNVQTISACTMGIYLSHMLWLSLLSVIFGAGSWMTVCGAFLCALLSCYFINAHYPWLRPVFGHSKSSGKRPLLV